MHAFAATFLPGCFRISELAVTIRELLMDSGILTGKGLLLAAVGILFLTVTDLIHEKRKNLYDILAARPGMIRWMFLYLLMLMIQFAVDFSNASSAFMYANF